MMKLMEESAFLVASALNEEIEKGGGVAELKIDDYTRSFAGDVILRSLVLEAIMLKANKFSLSLEIYKQFWLKFFCFNGYQE